MDAAISFEKVVDLLPEWPGSYATLGFFYYETGQMMKTHEVLDRFKDSNASGGLDVQRIQDTLRQAAPLAANATAPLSGAQKQQLLALATYTVDKTL